MENKIVHKDESFNIIGAAMEVHKVVGCGFTEPLYQDALEEELRLRDIPFEREKTYYFTYKGKRLDKIFRPDFVCYNKVIVELKTVAVSLMSIMPKCTITLKQLEWGLDY